MVWKETLMAMTTDWGCSKKEQFEEEFKCGFVSRLNERCGLHYESPRWLYTCIFQHFNEGFPKHFVFANFQCLRCGECCDDQRSSHKEDINRWMIELRYDILEYVDCWSKNGSCINLSDLFLPCDDCNGGEIVSHAFLSGRCPFVRKVRKKPYYKCRIHKTASEECRGYLCKKSIPVAYLNWIDVEDLIKKIGLKQYESLTRRKR